MTGRRGWGLLGVGLLIAGCADLSLDAPPPATAAVEEPAASRTAAKGAAGKDSPLWLRDLAGRASPGGPVRPGLGAETDTPAYSGETLTHENRAPAGSQEGPTDLAAALTAAKGGAAVDSDPVSLQSAALPIVGGFRIQLATLADPGTASTAWQDLQTAHPKILGSRQMILVDLNLGYRGVFHRLEAGPFETLTAAWEACIALVRRRQGCVVSQP